MCFARGLYCYNTSVKYLLVTLYSLFFFLVSWPQNKCWPVFWWRNSISKLSDRFTLFLVPLHLPSLVSLLCELALRKYKVRQEREPWPHAWPERCGRCTRTCPHQRWSPAAHAKAGPLSAHRSVCLNAAWQRCLWSFRPLYRSAGCPAPYALGRRQLPCGKVWQESWGWRAETGSGRTRSWGPGGRSGCPWGRGFSHTDCRTEVY